MLPPFLLPVLVVAWWHAVRCWQQQRKWEHAAAVTPADEQHCQPQACGKRACLPARPPDPAQVWDLHQQRHGAGCDNLCGGLGHPAQPPGVQE